MRVFLSHAGDLSRSVAMALHDWLPLVIQNARPFISTDIEKGKRWNDAIATELNQSVYGIICVTQENLARPWLYFEGGAISKAIDRGSVSPLLFGVSPAEIKGPFEQFQLTTCTRSDIWALVVSINNQLDPGERVGGSHLNREFDAWWPHLNKQLEELAKQKIEVTQTAYPWLYALADLTRVHRDRIRSEVWWVTPDLYRYALQPEMKEAIRQCAERGISHTFIVRESEHLKDTVQQLKRIVADTRSATYVIDIPGAEFDRLAVTDYIIMDPDADSMAVFLELPLQDLRGYWIKVSDGECAGGFESRFRKLFKDHVRSRRLVSGAVSRVAAGANGSPKRAVRAKAGVVRQRPRTVPPSVRSSR